MPVFGKSLFETVLDSVATDEDEEDDAFVASSVRGFAHGFVGRELGAMPDMENDPSHLFDDFAPDPLPETQIVPAWIGRLSDAEIAEDLGLENCRGVQDIRDRRRAFARDNHPDRISSDYRDQATHRMKTANRLIDDALRKAIRI